MTELAYGVTVFCDDIRHEVNGKMTLVGCYASEMNFSGPPPGILPTFAALVNLRFPRETVFETLHLQVTKVEGSETTEIFSAETAVSADAFLDKAESAKADAGDKILSVVIPIQWTPLIITAPALLRVRAKLDSGQEVRAGTLAINFPVTDGDGPSNPA